MRNKCEVCGAELEEESIQCPSCMSFKKTICPNCKKEINSEWSTCLHCGINLKSKKNIGPKFKNLNSLILVMPILVIMLIIVGLTAFAPNAEKYIAEGVSLYNEENYDEALEKFDKALELNPNLAEVWFYKGIILQTKDMNKEALECYEKSIEINPKNALVWYNKGTLMNYFGLFSEAIACYNKAINIDPNLSHAWYNKGLTLCNMGKYPEAINCFDKVTEIGRAHV